MRSSNKSLNYHGKSWNHQRNHRWSAIRIAMKSQMVIESAMEKEWKFTNSHLPWNHHKIIIQSPINLRESTFHHHTITMKSWNHHKITINLHWNRQVVSSAAWIAFTFSVRPSHHHNSWAVRSCDTCASVLGIWRDGFNMESHENIMEIPWFSMDFC